MMPESDTQILAVSYLRLFVDRTVKNALSYP